MNDSVLSASQAREAMFFPYVQVLRAFAALCVVVGHALHEVSQYAVGRVDQSVILDLVYYPYDLGIHIFFVISGFVIAYTGWHFERGWAGVRQFWTRRFIRIVPLYWFYTSLMILVLVMVPSLVDTARPDIGHFIQSYLFYPHIRPAGEVRPVLSLGWTLNYEMFFYVIFSCLFFFPIRYLMRLLCAVFVLLVIAGHFIPAEFTALHFWTQPIILEFLCGVVIAWLYVCRCYLNKIHALLCCIVSVVVMGVLYFTLDLYGLHHPVHLVMKGGVGMMLVAVAVLYQSSFMQRAPVVFMAMGNSSYSLYLSHPFILGVVTFIWSRFDMLASLPLWVLFMCLVAACVVGGHIAYLCIEKPLMRFSKSIIKPQP